jgi:hypothetical protein
MFKSDYKPFTCIYFTTNAVTIIFIYLHLDPLQEISLLEFSISTHSERRKYTFLNVNNFIQYILLSFYMPQPYNSSSFNHPNNIWWSVQIIMLFIIHSSPLPVILSLLCLNLNTLSLPSSPKMTDQLAHQNKTQFIHEYSTWRIKSSFTCKMYIKVKCT